MVGLSEVDELDEQVAEDHDVIGFQVQVHDAEVSNVAQRLDDGEDEVYFVVERH